MFNLIRKPKELRLIEDAEKLTKELFKMMENESNLVRVSLVMIAIGKMLDGVKDVLSKKLQEELNKLDKKEKED